LIRVAPHIGDSEEKEPTMNVPLVVARTPDHAIDPMFLNRHSARAFTEAAMSEAELLTLLEAARWAPSASNLQPTRFVWSLRGEDRFTHILQSLAASNRIWAEKAAALVVVASRTAMDRDGAKVALGTHAFDAGAAWMSLALQAHLRGWIAHAMGGFDKASAAQAVTLPEDHTLHAVVALGRPGTPDLLPESYRPREVPSGRLPLGEIARHGGF
jgi:nitroreductase